jgi:hypothetical protein
LPHPSDIPARLPFAGQFGVQHDPMYTIAPAGQEQVPPQPLDMPPALPSLGQLGVQQLPP